MLREEDPVKLTCHDWHSEDALQPWNPDVIRERDQKNGWWTVQVVRAGRYTFRMQDLPDEATEDKRLQAVRARLQIGPVDLRQDISPGATSVLFTAELAAGPTIMNTWLFDEIGDSRGAAFVYVEWQEAGKE